MHAEGYELVLIDERLHDDPEGDLLAAADGALCVGISTMTGFQLKGAIRFSRMVRKEAPSVPIIWGGYHPSLLPEQTASEPYVDAVVRGQGERTFQEIVTRLEGGGDLTDVAGVTYRNQAGEVISYPDRPMTGLEGFPPAPYELLDIDRFFRVNGGRHALQYISSQGCPYKCKFCVEPKVFGKWSGRSAEQVADDIEELDRRYGLEHITFSDPNFFVSRKRVEEICNLLMERGLKISWSAAARADQVVNIDPGLSRLMAQSGCSQIGIGMESGSQAILDLIDKRISPEKAIASNSILEDAGIQGCYAFMVGFPPQLPEARGEIWQTLMLIKAMRRAHPEVVTITFYVTPYPGTPLYDIALQLQLEMPRNTEEWADWESTSVHTTWISNADKDLVERCNNFYFPFAFPNRRLRKHMAKWKWKAFLYPLHLLAAARCRFDFYRWPFEWRLMQRLGNLKRFRRISSQIGALRGN
ncbi:radical SAM superfamily protein [bacterium BMS3Abin01]|nr:radical SAM superfamily protein [bacterium BMS3Abin01]